MPADPTFLPMLEPPAGSPSAQPPLVFTVRGDAVHVGSHEPVDGAGGHAQPGGARLYLGRLGDVDCWAVDVDGDDEPDVVVTPLLALHASVSDLEWQIAGRAVQLVAWRRDHRFCGRCGTATEPVPGERATRCPSCRLLAFPRLAPAVITLVTRDDGRALLARNANFPVPMFSCIAGFVEPGETLEQAVTREVAEEVGVRVGAVRYAGSQPWPFPHSLMIGFRARWAGGDITVDGTEIAEAAWFPPDELPPVPPRLSIARRLIDEWLGEERSEQR